MTDEPIVPSEGSRPFGAEVIDLDGVRIQHGMPVYRKGGSCQHHHLAYNPGERRVWCEDCERTIESFDAFMVVVKSFQAMARAARHNMEKADAALKATINRRAAKEVDRAWSGRGMAILCPHCQGGLLPEDFVGGGALCSRDIELARRKRAKEQE
jgi:Zn finger protein HypA/HybF involved in hydrogenase expression